MLMDNNSYGQQAAPVAPIQPYTVPTTKNKKDLIKNVALAVLAVIAIAFGTLALLKISDYNKLSQDFDTKLSKSVTEKVDSELTKIEAEYNTKYNQPYNEFVGPEDYGRVTFKYPRTWSVYVASDVNSDKNYMVYFNPDKVLPTGKKNVYALTFEIVSDSYENTTAKYSNSKNNMRAESLTISGSPAIYYTGVLPGTTFEGAVVVLKNRDKAVVFKTYDAAFIPAFNELIESITFNS